MRRTIQLIMVFVLMASICIGVGTGCSDDDDAVNPTPSPSASPANLDEIPSGNNTAGSNNGVVVNVDESYSGKQVEISVGDSLVITLESNASTGYSWALLQNSDESVLSNTGDRYVDPQTAQPMVGAPGVEEWTFKALKKGTATISMAYKRSWESTAPAETFDLTVVVRDVVNVDESYSGKQVKLSIGDSLVITLPSNASTGYSWALLANSDASVLSNTTHEYIAPPQTTPPIAGAPGKEEWTFQALKAGTSTISMGYARSWESIPPAQTFDLTVVVE